MERIDGDLLIDRVREIVAMIFGVPQESVTAESSPATIERWDSLGRLVLTVELEQEFGVQVPPEQTEELTTVGAIAAWLAANGAVAGTMESAWAR